MKTWIPLLLTILLVTSLSRGQTRPVTTDRAEDEREVVQLQLDLQREFQNHEYAKAVRSCQRLIEVDPKNVDGPYDLACALARLGQKDQALDALTKSIDLGFTGADHMRQDDDLVSLHENPRFAGLLAAARENEKKAPHEEGEKIAGVKTIEDFPEGGLRYRLRMSPDATVQKPNRLIIWLHPSGVSGDIGVERLSPRFIKQGYALVVLTQKQYMNWTNEEAEQLFKHTLPAVAQVPGIDASKPVLLGFSAGGQLALLAYYDRPGDFGGLILDAAYPLDMDKYVPGQKGALSATHELSKDPAIKEVPLFVLVGDKDGGSIVWQKVETDWRKAGVPLTLIIVSNQSHAWLFGKKQLDVLEGWLGDVAAGLKPSNAQERQARGAGTNPATHP